MKNGNIAVAAAGAGEKVPVQSGQQETWAKMAEEFRKQRTWQKEQKVPELTLEPVVTPEDDPFLKKSKELLAEAEAILGEVDKEKEESIGNNGGQNTQNNVDEKITYDIHDPEIEDKLYQRGLSGSQIKKLRREAINKAYEIPDKFDSADYEAWLRDRQKAIKGRKHAEAVLRKRHRQVLRNRFRKLLK